MDVFGMTALILLCGYMYQTGKSSIADISFALSVFLGISGLSFSLILEIKMFIEKWGKAVGSYTGLIQPIEIEDMPDAKDLVVTGARLEIRDLSFQYNKASVLKKLSFSVEPGERVGIVGLSGAGKTTLVNLIMRLYDPTGGAIYIDGQDIKTVTQESLHKNIAFIPQDSTMFNRTIAENIKYGKPDATEKEVAQAARDASADQFIKSAPNKYDTYIGDRGIKLSGGQRQRLAIARAFLKDAPSAINAPAPPSLVAEPPIPIIIFLQPLSKASFINCPVPYVVVNNGFLSSAFKSGKPDACAISIIAVSFSFKIAY
jgi:ATP-binding cassette subfamily B multidrug efflux pump